LNFRLREAQSRATHLRLAPMRFYFDLIRYPFLAECNDALKLSLLLVLSQFANAAGFFYQFGRHTLERSEHRRTVPSLSAAPPEY
jgi:hypothetical protein